MKSKLLLWLLLLCSGSAWAQLPVTERFETDGEGTRYTSTTTVNTVSPNRYFYRAQNPVSTFGNPNNGTVTLGNMDGSYLWACEGVRGTSAGASSTTTPGTLTLNPINNTQSYTNLQVTVAFADPRGNGQGNPNITAADHVRIQYRYGTTAAYTVAGEFTRDPSLSGGALSLWTRIGGTGTTPALNSTSFSDHTFNIGAGTGALYVQIEADYYGSNKEIAFDNIRVTGTASSVPKPIIVSNTGTGTLTFAEGTSARLTVFPDLSLTNPGMTSNPTLTGATVSIATGYAGAEDELTYTIPAGSGIALTGNTGQTLTFGGTATLANYEALLESIQYKDTDSKNATAGDRKLSFLVKSTVDSAPLERIITVLTALNPASSLPYSEPFDTNDEGTGYASNTRVSNSNGFVRLTNASNGSATPGSGFVNGTTTTFTNVQGPGYWYTNGTQGVVAGGVGRVTLAPVNSAGFTNLRFKVRVGATSGGFTSTEFVRFSYSTDGGTSWTVFANYAGDGTALRLNGNTANPVLTTALINPEFALPASLNGATISFRAETNSGGSEQIVFDDIQITGQPQTTVNSLVRASATPTNAATVTYTVTFGGSVTGLSATNFSLTTTGSVSGASVGTPVAGTGNTWSVPVNTGTGNGTLTLNLANDTNLSADVTTTLPFAGETYTIDKTAPAAPVVATLASGSTIATTSPPYTGTAEANSTVTVIVDDSSIGTTTANGSGNWNLTQPTALAQGSHTVRATATDAAGNTSPSSSPNSFLVDTTPPSVAISSPAGASGSSTGTTPIPFTLTFSESVTGPVQNGLTVTGGTPSALSSSGTTYTFTVTPSASGTPVTVNVAANTAQDQAGNFNTAAPQFSLTYQQPLVATAQNVLVNLDANGNATLNASSVNSGSTGPGTLTYTIQKIVYGRVSEGSTLTLTTPSGANFQSIRFASYGTPIDNGNGNYQLGACNAANSLTTARNSYIGRSSGSLDATNGSSANNTPTLGDPCSGTPKALAVQAAYSADAASLGYTCAEAGKTQYVLLTVTNGSATSTAVAQVTVIAPPPATLTSVNPTAALRGTSVTVTGINLSGIGSTVIVNGALATVSNSSASSFTFVVPAGATTGTGTIAVTAACAQTVTTAFTVQAPIITVAPATLPGGTVATAYSQTLSASGGTAPYSYAITAGALPAGLTLASSGVLAGTPTAAGTFTFTVTATEASAGPGSASGSRTYSLLIGYADLVISASSQTIPAGTYNSITVQRDGVGTLAGNVTVNGDVTVQSGGVLQDGCALISGAGSFTLAAGGTLSICAAQGISSSGATGAVQVTGTRSFSSDALYVYTGTVTQVTGTGLPATVRTLTLTNPAGLSLTNALTTSTAATFTSGVLTTGATSLTLGSGATLGEDADGYVTGTVQATRNLTTAGSPEAFGGLGLMLTPSGSTLPGSTLVRRVTGTALSGAGSSTSIKRSFDIQPTVNTGLNVALVLTARDDERNGIVPTNLRLFKSEDQGASWQLQGATYSTATAGGLTTYSASLSGISDFSLWTLGDAAAPLPVTLTSFQALLQDENRALLRWATASELHSSYFAVERSLDGSAFVEVGRVTAGGTSFTARTYELRDPKPLTGQTYYRLRQVDTDQSVTYSSVVTLAPSTQPVTAVSIHPNPRMGPVSTSVELLGFANQELTIHVTDMLGRTVSTQQFTPATSHATVALLLPDNLATGVYGLSVNSGRQQWTTQLIVAP